MKIVNKTRWQTRDIRRLVAAVLRFEKADASYRRLLTVRVENRTRTAGSAPYNEHWMTIRLWPDRENDPRQVAGTIAHEMLHNRGVKHKHMATYLYDGDDRRSLFAWAANYEIRPRAEKAPKPKPPIIEARELHARRMLARAERDAKSASRRIKLWQNRVRYYENRKLKAAAKAAEPEKETT